MFNDQKATNLQNAAYRLQQATSKLNQFEYEESMAFLDIARRSLIELQAIKKKEENERLLDEAIRLVHEDYDLRKKVYNHYAKT